MLGASRAVDSHGISHQVQFMLQHLIRTIGAGQTSGTRARIFSTYSSPISAGVPEAVCSALNSLGSSGANAVSSPAA